MTGGYFSTVLLYDFGVLFTILRFIDPAKQRAFDGVPSIVCPLNCAFQSVPFTVANSVKWSTSKLIFIKSDREGYGACDVSKRVLGEAT